MTKVYHGGLTLLTIMANYLENLFVGYITLSAYYVWLDIALKICIVQDFKCLKFLIFISYKYDILML